MTMKAELGFHKDADEIQSYGHYNNYDTAKLQMRVSECG